MSEVLGRQTTAATPIRSRRRLLRPLLFLLLPVALLFGGYEYVRGGAVMSTENAYVRADMVAVSTDISGIVATIAVHENQQVHAGDVLFRLDDLPFRLALDRANAQIGIVTAGLEAMKASFRDMQAQIRQAQVDVDFYDREQARQQHLVGSGASSAVSLDQATRSAGGARQHIASLQQQLAGIVANLAGNPDIAIADHPRIREAVASRDEAARQLDHTTVRAPMDGIVTNVPSLQPGQYLAAAGAAFSLVATDHMWVEANPKETELTWVRPGQDATIAVDTYPDQAPWRGTVESISPASASSFSMLPAQNTSGNWVKVVQRIPMRVRIETPSGQPPLRAGMSVVLDIDTGRARGLPTFLAALVGAPVAETPAFTPVANRGAITACVILAVIMQALDTTIANVALPYIQGSVSASQDQINWVLTSYIVAAAIMTPPSGWLSARFGRKRVLLVAVAGFVAASILCGLAQSLVQIVAFRLLQGFFGAALVPLSQSILLDIYTPAERGGAMALFGVSVMVGPVLGPVIGGWLTDNINWRWVFYINLPLGILAFLGVSAFVKETAIDTSRRLDWMGFGTLSVTIAALQLFLDRGEQLDWFGSGEVITEAVVAASAFYLFIAHTFTSPRPFVNPSLFRDRNFAVGMFFIFIVGITYLASLALMTPYLQTLMGYPVTTAGIVMGPRGMGTMVCMFLVGRLIGRVDIRILLAIGLALTAWAMWDMTGWTPDVSQWTIVSTGFIQGAGLGFLFVPLTTVTFSTLPADKRGDGTGLYNLSRNIGSAVGISVVAALLTENTQANHEQIAAYVTPFNRALHAAGAAFDPLTMSGRAALDDVVTTQASIIAYIDDFKLMMILSIAAIPLLLLLRAAPRAEVDHSIAVE